MTTEVFTTGAVFALEDRFSVTLQKLLGGLAEAEGGVAKLQGSLDRLGLGGMKGISSKFAAEWEEVGKVTDTGVNAVLKKMDRIGASASPVFAKIPGAARTAFGEVETLAGALPENMAAKMSAGMDVAAGKLFSPMVAASKVASAEVAANIAGVTGAIEAATGKMQAAGAGGAVERSILGNRAPRSGGFGRARHGDGLHFGCVGGDIGGVHMSIGGNAAMAAAGLALDGIYDAALIDDAVAKALMTSQIPIGPEVSKTDAGKRIHDMIQNGSKMTGFSFHDTGESVLEGQRLLSQLPFGKRNDLIESIMPSAAYEARQKGSTFPEAIEAIIGIAHQTQTYDPEGIQKIAKSLAYTSLLTPSPLPQFQGALGYSMPELHNGLDMGPSVIMLLTATMQQSGIKGTKSGTWLRSFFENSEPGSEEHNEALRKLGMLNADNKPSWRTTGADGRVDWQASVTALSSILQRDQQTIPIDERIGLLRKAYGERGAGFASLMMGEQFAGNLASATRGMNSFKGGEDALSQYASASILQQGRVALQEFNVAMSDLGTKLMPTATSAIKGFSEIMKTIDSDGPKGLLKLFYDKTIKQDVDPVLKQLTPGGPGAVGINRIDPGADAFGLDDMRSGLLHKQAYRTDTFGGDGNGLEDTIYRGTLRAFTDFANGGKLGGGTAGAGSGFMNAAYTTWDNSSPLPLGHPGRSAGGSGGFNPYAGGNGAGAFVPPVGDHLTAGMRNNNLGNIGFFGQHTAGMIGPSNARDIDHSIARFDTQESGIRAAASLALHKYLGGRHDAWDLIAAKGGWTPGSLGPGASVNVARAMGLSNHDDLHLDRPDQMVKFLHGLAVQEHGPAGRFYSEDRIRGALGQEAMPTVTAPSRKTVSPGSPGGGSGEHVEAAMHRALGNAKLEVALVYDRHHEKHVAKFVTKHQAIANRFPTDVGPPNMRSHYSNPAGTPVTDAA